MLRFTGSAGRDASAASRREWLRIGGLAGLNWAFPGLVPIPAAADDISSDAASAPGFGRAKSVIVLFASGGQSQLDMWDPKPEAPAGIRGAFGTIESALPGVRLCEHLPLTAGIADRICLVRNMAHEDLDHGSAFYLSMTGRYHRFRSGNPLPGPDDLPCHGAILHRVRPSQQFAQTAVHLNGPAEVPVLPAPGQSGGILGKGYDPLTLGDVTRDDLAVPALRPQADLPPIRIQARRSLLQSLESSMRELEGDRQRLDKSELYQHAFEMLSRRNCREAFELSLEPATVRDRYGRNRTGQACLLARRLVEAGVPLVTVMLTRSNRGQDFAPDDTDQYGWDTHNDIFEALQHHLLPRFDTAYSALIEDLDARGLLDSTLVVCMGEFGRAPIVALEPRFAGATPGRKHWPWVYSVALAGAGVRRGTVVGESDNRGAYPRTQPCGPWDLMATMFSALGIDPHQHYTDLVNRPIRICDGQVLRSLYEG